jgi:hypothetical protein
LLWTQPILSLFGYILVVEVTLAKLVCLTNANAMYQHFQFNCTAETHATRTPHFGMDFIEPIANMPAVGDTRGLVRDTRGLAHHPSNDRSEFRVNEWVNLRVNALGQKIQLEANY